MDLIAQERDRLLRTTTRVVGIVCALVSVVAVLCAGSIPTAPLVVGLLGVAVLVGADRKSVV